MKRKRIVFVNTRFEGADHEIIDSSLIIGASFLFDEVVVRFLPRRSNFISRCVANYPRKGAANLVFKAAKSLRFFRSFTLSNLLTSLQELFIYLFSDKKDSVFCFTVFSSFNYYLINLAARFVGTPVVFCCHNEMEELVKKGPSAVTWHFANSVYCHSRLAECTRFIVFSRSIFDSLANFVSADRLRHFSVWQHPYFGSDEPSAPAHLHSPISIAVIGFLSADYERGFDNVLDLANKLKAFPDFQISVISRIQDGLEAKLPDNVKVLSSGRQMPREDYVAAVRECDYIFIPYPSDAYSMTPSGALLQAICLKKPVLMFSTSFASYVENDYGKFGYFLDKNNIDDLLPLLSDAQFFGAFYDSESKIADALLPDASLDKLSRALGV